MSPLFANLLVLIAVGVAAYFARQQVATLRGLNRIENLSPEDRAYFRWQAWRRLFGCCLLLTIGLMIAGAYLSGLVARIDELGAAREAARGAGRPLDPEQKWDVQLFWAFVMTVLVML